MIRKLIIGNGRSERELVLAGNVIIGRDATCHISEPDPLLSRRHAEVLTSAHGVSIRDLDSRNGVLVNGEKTREQVLFADDVIQLGHLQLRYVEQPDAAGLSSQAADKHEGAPSGADTYKPQADPLPGRNASRAEPQPRVNSRTPLPRGRAAFDDVRAPAVPDHAPVVPTAGQDGSPSLEARRGDIWNDPQATVYGGGGFAHLASDSAFASALAHFAGNVVSAVGPLPEGTGARLTANAELTVVEATPECSALLGVPGEVLIGDSLPEVFLRGVRRVYAMPDTTLSLAVAAREDGSMQVTFSLTSVGERER